MIDCFRSVKIGQLIGEYKDVAPEHLTAFGPIIDSIVVPFDPIYLYHTEFYNWLIPTDNKYVKTDNETDNIAQHYSSFAAIAADPLSLARSYDLLLGITDADTPCLFSDQESMNGVDSDRHDRILRTLVRNLYDYHQQVSKRKINQWMNNLFCFYLDNIFNIVQRIFFMAFIVASIFVIVGEKENIT